jgi:hypothetical protein
MPKSACIDIFGNGETPEKIPCLVVGPDTELDRVTADIIEVCIEVRALQRQLRSKPEFLGSLPTDSHPTVGHETALKLGQNIAVTQCEGTGEAGQAVGSLTAARNVSLPNGIAADSCTSPMPDTEESRLNSVSPSLM